MKALHRQSLVKALKNKLFHLWAGSSSAFGSSSFSSFSSCSSLSNSIWSSSSESFESIFNLGSERFSDELVSFQVSLSKSELLYFNGKFSIVFFLRFKLFDTQLWVSKVQRNILSLYIYNAIGLKTNRFFCFKYLFWVSTLAAVSIRPCLQQCHSIPWHLYTFLANKIETCKKNYGRKIKYFDKWEYGRAKMPVEVEKDRESFQGLIEENQLWVTNKK